jgi:hypothetical protein
MLAKMSPDERKEWIETWAKSISEQEVEAGIAYDRQFKETSPKKRIKLSTLPTSQQIYRGLGILLRYDSNFEIASELGNLILISTKNIGPKELDPSDKKRLKLLGFRWDSESESWSIALDFS